MVYMLYLIGGVPRAGKSILRKEILDRYKISGLDIATLHSMIEAVLPRIGNVEIPEGTPVDEYMWPWLNAFIEQRLAVSNEYFVLEGDYFSPESLVQYKDNPNCKVCFILYADMPVSEKMSNIRLKSNYSSEWGSEITDDMLQRLVEESIERSQRYKKMCQLLGIEYFDTSEDFEAKIEEAMQYLLGR